MWFGWSLCIVFVFLGGDIDVAHLLLVASALRAACVTAIAVSSIERGGIVEVVMEVVMAVFIAPSCRLGVVIDVATTAVARISARSGAISGHG